MVLEVIDVFTLVATNPEPEDYLGQADYSTRAALYGFLETAGFPTYSLILEDNLTPKTGDIYNISPGETAAIAYAGIYHENYWTGKIDPAKSREFWQWWLTEALPKAWEQAQ